jgi:hypothetical protein
MLGSNHQRCQSLLLLGIRIGSFFFQEELNKIEVGLEAQIACTVQGRHAGESYSVDVGAVFDKLFARMSWFTWVE